MARRITKQEFSDGTTIDGSRLDAAVQDIVGHVNKVPLRDIAKRFVRSTYVMGLSPSRSASCNFPLLPLRNDSAVAGGEPESYSNPFRVKGTKVPGVDHFADPPVNDQLVWTVPVYFHAPVILDSVHLALVVDGPSATDPMYEMTFLDSLSKPASDLCLLVHVDNDFRKEDRRLNSVIATRNRFVLEDISQMALSVPSADMSPAHPGAELAGKMVSMEDIGMPIPRGSRVRLAVVIPDDTGTGTDAWDGVIGMTWGLTMTVLEEVQRGF